MPDITETTKIERKKVIAVEGKDGKNFIDALLKKYLKISDCQVIKCGGRNNFKNRLPELSKLPGFSEVEIFAIICDADNDSADAANNAFISIRNIILRKEEFKKYNFKPPTEMNQFSKSKPKVGIFIMPGNSDKGMLEDLCLKTVKDRQAMKCVDPFIDCVKKLDKPPKNMSKAKAQAFLAAMPVLAKDVGIGAQKGYWNFNSNELEELKLFLDKFK